ncbi:MAG: DUF2075 domain-containing protein [Canibacter sp.]
MTKSTSIQFFVEELNFSNHAFETFQNELKESEQIDKSQLLLDFPTVYIVQRERSNKFRVYVGESSDIRGRTSQHLTDDIRSREDWKELARDPASSMYVIGHSMFNKSLTLDIENRLIHWLSSIDTVEKVFNRRSNPQNNYFTRNHLDSEFQKIWESLRRKNSRLFPTEAIVKQSALFKASPFHKLTEEQINAKVNILDAIRAANETGERGQLILVQGAAGSGKTVLLSSLFYELFQQGRSPEDPFEFQALNAYLLVNHQEQLTVYQEIAKKLGLIGRDKARVSRPTSFINARSTDAPVDVVLIDEAHLLWTQGKQGYKGKNQLKDILDRAKVVVAVFDPAQGIATNNYWEDSIANQIFGSAREIISLNSQMRINSSEETLYWIRSFIDRQTIAAIPEDSNYEIKVFDNPTDLREAISQKVQTSDNGISRVTATFDWPYSSKNKAEGGQPWKVNIDHFSMNWNLQIEYSPEEKRATRAQSWIEQPQTIDEIGSHFTVQGFDLNYAGVIIGPSVKFRNGRVVFDPAATANKSAVQKRTMADGSKQSIAETLLQNELNILLTRGVNGLYLYAVDDALQNELRKAQGSQANPS